jgi:AraC-like DNA-binding protein
MGRLYMTVNLHSQIKCENKNKNKVLETFINNLTIDILGCGYFSPELHLKDFVIPYYMILYCMEGTRVVITHKNTQTVLKPGTFFLFRPLEVYSAFIEQKSRGKNLYIYFRITPLTKSRIFAKFAFHYGDMFFHQIWYQRIGVNLKSFIEDNAKDVPLNNFMLQHITRGIIAHIMYYQLDLNPNITMTRFKSVNVMEQALDYALDHLNEPISIGKTAAALRISRTKLNKCFKDAYNETPSQVITRAKIFEGLNLMNNGTSVKETAKALGYSSSFHFSKVFKTLMGSSPSHYLKKRT